MEESRSMLSLTPSEYWNGSLLPVTVGGREFTLFVREAGPADAPVLLFLHGFPTSSLDWSRIAPAFTDRRCLFVDLLGFGHSEKPRLRYSYPLQADLVAALIAEKRVSRLSIIAHDYAVTVAQELLLREQAGRLGFAIERIVYLNGGVYGRQHRLRRFHRLLLTPVLGGLVARRVSPTALTAGLNDIAGRPDAWSAVDGEAHWRALSARGGLGVLPRLIHYVADRKAHGARWEDAMEQAAAKSEFVWGPADPVSGAHVLDEVRRHMPGVRIETLGGVGHYPHWEAPNRAARAIRAGLGIIA
jgi:pimeloyl-ACP methyl ester carboxylesterase